MPSCRRAQFALIPLLGLLAVAPELTLAQRPRDITLPRGVARAVVESVRVHVRADYVLPGVAARVDSALGARLRAGRYDGITSGLGLTDTIGDHLYEISGDKHLGFAYSPNASPVVPPHPETPEERERDLRLEREDNFGFVRIEWLPGNVGYLEFRRFVRPAFAGDHFAAAMTLLATTDALIVDLRRNRGGDPDMVTYVASWFFGDEPVHLANEYHRPTGVTEQEWTLAHVPSARYQGKSVYLLTSRSTYSAAEGLAYELRALDRVTLVGERTRGGAHPSEWFKIHPHFSVVVPTTRVTSPRTGANWEGTGVAPDVACPADSALTRAQLLALDRLLVSADAGRRAAIEERIRELRQAP